MQRQTHFTGFTCEHVGLIEKEPRKRKMTDPQNDSVMNTVAGPGNQVVGNIGLFYICYRLSRLGWNVMPTARNARGVDVLIYSSDARRTHTVQVKALSRRSPVPLGSRLEGLLGDFFVICRNVAGDEPECFVLTPTDVRQLAHKGEKDGKISFWLQPKQYESDEFKEKWDRIGRGSSSLELAKIQSAKTD